MSQMAGSLFPIEGVLIANMQNNLYATDPDKVRDGQKTREAQVWMQKLPERGGPGEARHSEMHDGQERQLVPAERMPETNRHAHTGKRERCKDIEVQGQDAWQNSTRPL